MNYGEPLFKKRREKMGLIGDAAGAALNTGLGLMLQGHNDRRQVEQQQKLNTVNRADYQQRLGMQEAKEMRMWENTSYAAQVEQMKKAGLSPGLQYGGSGAGGSTVGGTAGSGGGSQAPAGGNEIMNLQLMQAQKELIQAQTGKAQAETQKTAGVDTDLTRAQGGIAEIERSMKSDTYDVTYSKLQAEASKMESEAQKAYADKTVSQATVETEIKMKQGELIGLGLANELKESGVKLTDEQIKATIASVQQKWKEVSIKEGKLELDKFVNDVANSTRLTVQEVSKLVNGLLGAKAAMKRTDRKGEIELEKWDRRN